MKIGIPYGLSTYYFSSLYNEFFKVLNVDVVYSPDTNNEIIKDGINMSVDDNCLASKIYMGHVKYLYDNFNKLNLSYIFIPRICTYKNKDTVCVKFYALYDICKNLFNIPVLTIDIDYVNGKNECSEYIKLGKKLGFSYTKSLYSYLKAKKKYIIDMNLKYNNSLIKSNKLKILIVSHPYISHDKMLGCNVSEYLNKLDCDIVYADILNYKLKNSLNYKKISNSIYWKHNKHLLNGVLEYIDDVDGVIYLSVFPCAPDALVNELCKRKIKYKQSINIIMDDQSDNTGLYTRLESFVDILNNRRNVI
ncbi:MAG: acyl-CoA dehydratase activase-related protein [Clostridia bacterium]